MDGSDDFYAFLRVPMPDVGQKIGPNQGLELIAKAAWQTSIKSGMKDWKSIRASKYSNRDSMKNRSSGFQTEAKISAHLHHPNIVEIFGVISERHCPVPGKWNSSTGFPQRPAQAPQAGAFHLCPVTRLFRLQPLHYAHNQVLRSTASPTTGSSIATSSPPISSLRETHHQTAISGSQKPSTSASIPSARRSWARLPT